MACKSDEGDKNMEFGGKALVILSLGRPRKWLR
jgi:hypothetical protein